MNKYKAFDIIFSSEIDIPEFEPGSGKAEVSIQLGKVPKKLNSIKGEGARYLVNEYQFLLKIDNVAAYYVEKGNLIIIEPLSDNENEIRIFLLGSVLGALLHQRSTFILHGSAVLIKDFAIAFSGKSGVGKSTLSGVFCKNKYPLICDDISPIQFDDQGKPLIYGSIPRIKLWEDAIEPTGYKNVEKRQIRENIGKYNVRMDSISHGPHQLNTIYILVFSNTTQPIINEVKGFEKFNLLRSNIYRLQFLEDMDKTEEIFSNVSKLASRVKLKKVLTTKNKPFDLLYNLILTDLKIK